MTELFSPLVLRSGAKQRRALRRYRSWLEARASDTPADTALVAASERGE